MDITPDMLDATLRTLQAAADDPSLLADNERFKSLVAKVHGAGRKSGRKRRLATERKADRALTAEAGIVRAIASERPLPPLEAASYIRTRSCYICKAGYRTADPFYHLLCPACASFNHAKRVQRADLAGRTALVTGGRIKIGYQFVLKLLRDGARVAATTRFPADALRRYRSESDASEWIDRLSLHPLDLRDLPEVLDFAERMDEELPALDILVHNAAQTIKRPVEFYQHLLEGESGALEKGLHALFEARPDYPVAERMLASFFPPGLLDRDGQQVDARPRNSWRLKIGDVAPQEMLEVLLTGTAAPFLLTNRLLPAMIRSPHPRRFIVHVSAMEGQFVREAKNAYHPHTNMAKAAMHMLTRTSAGDLADQGVFLTSVDTGWITDEKPLPEAERVRREQDFHPPLDSVDGAARIYDPIVGGLDEAATPVRGCFLKDYFPHPW